MDKQNAFDEAFDGLVEEVGIDWAEVTLDDLVEKLAAVGLTVQPWQRDRLAVWVEAYQSGVPLVPQVLRLRRDLLLEELWRAGRG
jgi:hypothetical protein